MVQSAGCDLVGQKRMFSFIVDHAQEEECSQKYHSQTLGCPISECVRPLATFMAPKWSCTAAMGEYSPWRKCQREDSFIRQNSVVFSQFYHPNRGESVAKNIFKFTVTGIVVGVALGWLLSLVSGNLFVVLMVGTLGLIVGGILGMVHRNDP